MDDNARTHRSTAVTAYLQSEPLTSVPWPAMSPNYNPTGSRLTNGSCTMSLNSNNVVLNTMPNVIVDVGLPTVDV
jgi:hypothetical protein